MSAVLTMTTEEELQEAAYWLLKSPLEFADSYTAELLPADDQREFTRILNVLRERARVS